MNKNLTALTITLLLLTGCGGTSDQSPEGQDAQQTIEESKDVYQAAYEAATAVLINDYGITETAELCMATETFDDDWETAIDNLATTAGLDPANHDEWDGAADAAEDICDN